MNFHHHRGSQMQTVRQREVENGVILEITLYAVH